METVERLVIMRGGGWGRNEQAEHRIFRAVKIFPTML